MFYIQTTISGGTLKNINGLMFEGENSVQMFTHSMSTFYNSVSSHFDGNADKGSVMEMDIYGNNGGAAGISKDFKEKYQCFMLRCKKICTCDLFRVINAA